MVSRTKRLSVLYQKQLPRALMDLVHSDKSLGYAKDGLVDFPPTKALRLILTMDWNNQPADLDNLRNLQNRLQLLVVSGQILQYELLDR